MFNPITAVINWLKAEYDATKPWLLYVKAITSAAIHGGWSSLSAVVGASVLDYSKFNLTNGLKSEFDLLLLVFLGSGGLAGYLYVKTNKPPAAPAVVPLAK